MFDEDTCATNFMLRDARIQALIAKEKEPITPLVSKVSLHIIFVSEFTNVIRYLLYCVECLQYLYGRFVRWLLSFTRR